MRRWGLSTDIAGAGLNGLRALTAEGAEIWRPTRNRKRGERDARNADTGVAAGAVDDGAGGEDVDAVITQQIDDFASATAGSDDVFDDYRCLASGDLKASAEGHFSGRVALSELKPGPERAGDFVADDQTA